MVLELFFVFRMGCIVLRRVFRRGFELSIGYGECVSFLWLFNWVVKNSRNLCFRSFGGSKLEIMMLLGLYFFYSF